MVVLFHPKRFLKLLIILNSFDDSNYLQIEWEKQKHSLKQRSSRSSSLNSFATFFQMLKICSKWRRRHGVLSCQMTASYLISISDLVEVFFSIHRNHIEMSTFSGNDQRLRKQCAAVLYSHTFFLTSFLLVYFWYQHQQQQERNKANT